MRGRPCRTDTVWFKRKLGASERKILLVAGRGDLTQGWHSLLEIYQKLWNNGYYSPSGVRYSQNAPSDSFIFFSWPAKFARPTPSYPQARWPVIHNCCGLCKNATQFSV